MAFWEIVLLFVVLCLVGLIFEVFKAVTAAKVQRDNVRKISDDLIVAISRGVLKFNLSQGKEKKNG